MPLMTIRRTLLIALGVLVLTAGVVVVGADSAYEISLQDSVEIPDQEVTIDGEQFVVDSYATVSPGATTDVTVDGPSGESYSLYLYNNNEQIIENKRMEGTETVTLDVSGFDPGTYVLVVNGPDGNYRAVHPLVINGYAVSFDPPQTATVGEEITVTAELDSLTETSETVSSVDIGVVRDNSVERTELTKVSNNTYRGTVSLSDTGSYQVYIGVRGTETIDDERELIGLSERETIEVQSEPTPTDTPTTEPDSSTGDGDSSSGDNTGDGTADSSTSTSTPTPTPTATATSESQTSEPATTTPPPSTTTASPTTDPATTTDQVLTPNETTPTPTQTTSVSTPLSEWLVLVAFLIGAGFVIRRNK